MDAYTGVQSHEAQDLAYQSSPPSPATDTRSHTRVIRTTADYEAKKDSRHRAADDNEKALQCPQTDAEKCIYVDYLFNAIHDLSGVADKEMKGGKPAQAVQKLMDGYYPDEAIEELCWDIVTKLNQSHSGIKLVDDYIKGRKLEKFETYDEKFSAICEALREHKSMVKNLLDPPFIDRLVDAPGFEMKSKKTNSIINARRDTENAIGRVAVRNGIKISAIQRLIQDSPDEEYPEPANELHDQVQADADEDRFKEEGDEQYELPAVSYGAYYA
ncbi:hypothetical protein PVAG01_10188 [Phlyctema vagabunda]|uniref:Uncharacterized protein n=1 Tax=Phlyctema vagabunda TaxID=108571 RepID=A0ABR4P583_9HELO